MAATLSIFSLFTLALAHVNHGNAHARLHSRQASPAPPVCQEEGVHMIVGSGAGAPQIEGYGLLETVVGSIKQALPGSTSYSVPFNKTTDPLYAATASAEGVVLMTENIKWYADGCPNTPIVLLGYSQGGIILMNTLCGRSTSTPWGIPLDSSYSDNILMSVTYGEETRQANQPYNHGTCISGSGILARQNLAGCDAFSTNIRSYCELNDPRCCVGSPAPNNDTHYVYPQIYDTDVTSAILAKYNEWKSAAPEPSETSEIPDISTTIEPSSVATSTSTATATSVEDVDSGVTSKLPILESPIETSTPCSTFTTLSPYTNSSTTEAVNPTTTPASEYSPSTTEEPVPTSSEEPVPTSSEDCSTTEAHPEPVTSESPEPTTPAEDSPVPTHDVVEQSQPAEHPTIVTEQHTAVTTEDCSTETLPPAASTPSAPPQYTAPPASSLPEIPDTTTSTLTRTSTRTLTSRLTITRTRPASTATSAPVPSSPPEYSSVPLPEPSEPVPIYTPSGSPSSPSIALPPYQTSLTPFNPNAGSRTQGSLAGSMAFVIVAAHCIGLLF